MRNILKKALKILPLLALILSISSKSYAQEGTESKDIKVATYFTGIGCPHCASASPTIKDLIDKTEGFILIEYEIYKESRNAPLITKYNDTYGIGLGIPVLFFNQTTKLVGDSQIKSNLQSILQEKTNINIFQSETEVLSIQELNVNLLNGYPKIYAKDRIALRDDKTAITLKQNDQIVSFLTLDLSEWEEQIWEGEIINPRVIEYPGGSETYEHALSLNGWILQWNGNIVKTTPEVNSTQEYCDTDKSEVCEEKISITKILGLALADSINPCAISVLLLMLLAIATYNPKDRKQILFSGLAFIAAVVIMYLLYGFLIIKAFQFLQSITIFKDVLYKGLGVAALILGVLEIKDFIKYKPGGIGTEMPLFLRPKMQNIVSKITSPFGAFSLGLFVTLFLLPCTIGPYVILGGMLSTLDFLKTLPYLLIYNVIFVLPMLVITGIIFFGTKNIKDVSNWKNKNVRKMHLISGILMIILGIVMLFGIL